MGPGCPLAPPVPKLPFDPLRPGKPLGPTGPLSPTGPGSPGCPWGPWGPGGPKLPGSPFGPLPPAGPFTPTSPLSPLGPGGPGLPSPAGLGANLPRSLPTLLGYSLRRPTHRVGSVTFLRYLGPYQAILLLRPLWETWLADQQDYFCPFPELCEAIHSTLWGLEVILWPPLPFTRHEVCFSPIIKGIYAY